MSSARLPNLQTRLHPSDTVRFAEINGLVVLLDLATEDYYVLNSTGSYFWSALIETGGDAIAVADMAFQSYPSIDGSRIRSDLARVVDEWRRCGFLTDRAVTAPVGKQWFPLGSFLGLDVCAFWCLAATAWNLRHKGFAPTYRSYGYAPMPLLKGDRDRSAAAAMASFVRMENLFHFSRAPQDCLPRSLALFRLCQCLGLPVRHCIGGRRFPQLIMHAWVELAGRVLLDNQDCREEFTLIASMPPLPNPSLESRQPPPPLSEPQHGSAGSTYRGAI